MPITKIDFEKQERAIELPDGSVLDIPSRTAEVNDKLVKLNEKHSVMSEYDFMKESLLVLFGKDSFKKIVPDEKKVDLDYLSAVYRTSVNLFMHDKMQAEKEEMEKKIEELTPLTNELKTINPLVSKM